jgi:hypothetical protein
VKFTYSGVTSDPINATMITDTIIVVLFSTLVCWSLSSSGFAFTMNTQVSLQPLYVMQLLVIHCMNFFYLQRFHGMFYIYLQVFGFLTKPLISYLLPHQETIKTSHRESIHPKEDLGVPFLSLEESVGTNMSRAKDSLSRLIERPVFTIHFYWRKFDDAYMRPVFGGPVSTPMDC